MLAGACMAGIAATCSTEAVACIMASSTAITGTGQTKTIREMQCVFSGGNLCGAVTETGINIMAGAAAACRGIAPDRIFVSDSGSGIVLAVGMTVNIATVAIW